MWQDDPGWAIKWNCTLMWYLAENITDRRCIGGRQCHVQSIWSLCHPVAPSTPEVLYLHRQVRPTKAKPDWGRALESHIPPRGEEIGSTFLSWYLFLKIGSTSTIVQKREENVTIPTCLGREKKVQEDQSASTPLLCFALKKWGLPGRLASALCRRHVDLLFLKLCIKTLLVAFLQFNIQLHGSSR